MKRIFFKLFVVCSLLPYGLSSQAYDIKTGGIYYNLDSINQTAEVTYNVLYSSTNYSGAVSIPETIEYKGVTYTVNAIGNYAFYGCTGVNNISYPASVKHLGYEAFYGFTQFTSWNMGNVTTIAPFCFVGCTNLKTINITDCIESISAGAFANCSSLTTINICDADGNIVESNERYRVVNSNTLVDKSDSTLVAGTSNSVIPDYVKHIGDYAFEGCTGLKEISFPSTVQDLGLEAFYGCTGLTTLYIPNTIEGIWTNTFEYCSSLTSITVQDGSSILYDSDCNAMIFKYNRSLFLGCSSTVIPNDVCKIYDSAFCANKGLKSITIPNSVKYIGSNAFYQCTGLATVVFPDSLKEIGNYAFYGCTALKAAILPATTNNIGNRAFYGCSVLSKLTVPNDAYMGPYAFYGTKSPFTVNVIVNDASKTSYIHDAFSTVPSTWNYYTPDNMTDKLSEYVFPDTTKVIPEYALFKCKTLTALFLPETLTTISSSSLNGSTVMADTYCWAETVPTVKSNGLPTSTYLKNATLHVPAASVDAYKSATGWKNFGSIIALTADDPNPYAKAKKGDVNGDDVVDIADVNAVLNAMTGTPNSKADVNGDGVVDIADVNAVLSIMVGQ